MTAYDLRSVRLPRLGTTAAKLLAATCEGPLGGLILSKLRADSGIAALTGYAATEAPSFLPRHAPVEPAMPAYDPAPTPPRFPAATAGSFRFPTIADITQLYAAKRQTPVEVADRVIRCAWKADKDTPPLRAMIALDEHDILRQAEESEQRWRAGAPLGPLDGVPIAIKDEVDVRGYPTTIGTSFYGARTGPATRDATVVARLRAAGAIIVGKANMHEIGIGVTGLNPHHGPARNPYDPAHHAGGSSGGSAAAVAAGLVPVAIGADGGGSIRMPAAFCGMIGLKSTFGRVSGHGAAPLCWSVGYLGPIAANAEDAALVYRTIAGPDPLDPDTAPQPPVEVDPARMYGLDGVRVGVYRPWFEHATGEVVGRCDTMLRILRERGAVATEIELPGLEPMRVAHLVTILSEMAAGLADVYDRHHGDFGPDARINLAVARTISSREYVHAQRLRTRAMATFAAAFEAVDLIATPSTAIPAPAIPRDFLPGGGTDASQAIEIMRYAFPGNLTGHPAISIPAGYTASGLPVGLQLTGRPWAERLLLRAATIAGLILERERPRRWYAILGEE